MEDTYQYHADLLFGTLAGAERLRGGDGTAADNVGSGSASGGDFSGCEDESNGDCGSVESLSSNNNNKMVLNRLKTTTT